MSISIPGTVLDRILARTQRDLEVRKATMSRDQLHRMIERQPPPIDFEASLNGETIAVIAEFKRASPSKGHFDIDVEAASVAASYLAGGASAISCLTDWPFFEGSLDDLKAVASRAYADEHPIGVLRKDFMLDAYQVEEARAYGASCILLIVAALEDDMLRQLAGRARELGMASLLEVHDEAELQRALAAGATLIGINNRDLRTLLVDLKVTERLSPIIPDNCRIVSESGFATREEVVRISRAGVDAILVGESIIVQLDRESAVKSLTGVKRRDRHRD